MNTPLFWRFRHTTFATVNDKLFQMFRFLQRQVLPILGRHSVVLVASLFMALFVSVTRADQIKANNNNNLELGSSWVSTVAPGGNDNAIWNSIITIPANCTNTLGTAVIWGGIVISN